MKSPTHVIAFILLLASPLLAQPVNILDHDAKGDGQTLATHAIQSAIDKAVASGGGTIYFPPGKFRSGTIRLKSNITPHLAPGCTLLGLNYRGANASKQI